MSKNIVKKTFTTNGVWTCPAGVKEVKVSAGLSLSSYLNSSVGLAVTSLKDNFNNLYSFGVNTSGQLGVGDITNRASPTSVVGGYKFVSYSVGSKSYGLTADGSLYSWGENFFGDLGVGDSAPRSSPTLVVGGYKFISSNIPGTRSYGLTADGRLYTWGINNVGQLGVGDITNRSSPTLVVGGYKFSSVIINDSAFGLTADGVLYGWGSNTRGQLGVGDITKRSSPTLVVGGYKFVSVNINDNSAFDSFRGLTADGSLYTWGSNSNGQLGVGDITNRSSPTLVVGGYKFVSVNSDSVKATGQSSYLGLTVDGSLYTWGVNTKGQLGVGDTTNRSSPTLVVGGYKFVSYGISGGGVGDEDIVSYGLTADGSLYTWGSNSKGQLGVGDTTNRSSPTLVVGGYKFSSAGISGSGSGSGTEDIVSYGLTADGSLYTWGSNASYRLGVGDKTNRSSPTLVVGGYKFSSVSFSGNSFGLTADGVLYGWGNNSIGSLGVGDSAPRSSPTLVIGGLKIESSKDKRNTFFNVVPGTTYTISIDSFPSFNRVSLYPYKADTITIEYEA